MRQNISLLIILAAFAALFGACASGDDTLEVVDPNAVVAEPTFDQINAIIQNKCVLCHEGSGEGEEDFTARTNALVAEDVPGFEDCTSIVAQRFEILEQVEENLMPPGAMPRLTSEEKLKLRRWVENGAPAPCNP